MSYRPLLFLPIKVPFLPTSHPTTFMSCCFVCVFTVILPSSEFNQGQLSGHGCGYMGELSVFCQSYFNKTLIGQAGSIGGKARQEIEVEQRDWEYSGKQEAPSTFPGQITEEATCELPS